MTTTIEQAKFLEWMSKYSEDSDVLRLKKAREEAEAAYKRSQAALREHEMYKKTKATIPKEALAKTVYKNAIFGLPKFILQNPLSDFAAQLCNEISLNRAILIIERDAKGANYSISANPSCVVSRNMMNYMLMAFAPGFSTKNIEKYEESNDTKTIIRRPTYGRVTEEEIDYREVAKQNHDLYLIAQNLISYEEFLKTNDKFNFMRLIIHNGQINFGVDSSLEDWQARVEYGTGDYPETLEGITDNRLYK